MGRPPKSEIFAKVNLPENLRNARYTLYIKRSRTGYPIVMRVLRYNLKPEHGETRKPTVAKRLTHLTYPPSCILQIDSEGNIIKGNGFRKH